VRKVTALLAMALLLGPGPARAIVIAEEIRVPVKVTDLYGKTVEQAIVVGLFHESSAPGPYPLLVLNHGRAATPAGFARVTVKDYGAAARWLAVNFGFLVAVPIRVGYGASGGPDVEYSGDCRQRNFPPVYHAAAVQSLAVLGELRKRADRCAGPRRDDGPVLRRRDGDRARGHEPGRRAGRDQLRRRRGRQAGHAPARSVQPAGAEAPVRGLRQDRAHADAVAVLGERPVLGPEAARRVVRGLQGGGGQGEFAAFPPVSDDGHRLFSRAPQLWQPRVREFLISVGYKPL
jgi:hypothetical protein